MYSKQERYHHLTTEIKLYKLIIGDPVLAVICHMEGSGKWPHDRLAIRHIRTAFHIRLGVLLEKQHGYTCKPCPAHLDVWKVYF